VGDREKMKKYIILCFFISLLTFFSIPSFAYGEPLPISNGGNDTPGANEALGVMAFTGIDPVIPVSG
jgi:hypothetical protein